MQTITQETLALDLENQFQQILSEHPEVIPFAIELIEGLLHEQEQEVITA